MAILPVSEKSADAWSAGDTTHLFFTGVVMADGVKGIIDYGCNVPAALVTGISQTGVTWVKRQGNPTTRVSEIWESTACSGAGGTITLTLASSALAAATISAGLRVFSGLPVGACYNTGAAANGTGDITAGSITPTVGQETLIISAGKPQNIPSAGPSNGFTPFTDSGGLGLAPSAYLIVPSTSGSYSTTWTHSGTWGATIAAFSVPNVTTLSLTTQPRSAKTGVSVPVPIVGQVLLNGSLDTSYNGNVTISKATGSGTLSGTLTVACVAGVFTFANVILTITAGTTATLTVTKASSGETVTSGTWRIREVPYTTTAGFAAQWDTVDSSTNTVVTRAKLFVPNGATAGIALPLIVYGPGAGVTGDPDVGISSTFGGVVNNNPTTFPWFALFPAIASPGGVAEKQGWRRSIHDSITRAIADGYNIDRSRIYYWGYSTGGIALFELFCEDPYLFAAMGCADATIHSGNLTNNGSGPPTGALPGIYNDTPGVLDVAAFAELARRAKACGVSLYLNHGTAAIGPGTGTWDGVFFATPYLRDIRNITPFLDAADALGGEQFHRLTTTTTTVPALTTSWRLIYVGWGASVDHGAIESRPTSSANWTSDVQAWYGAQIRTDFGASGNPISQMAALTLTRQRFLAARTR